MLKKDEGIRLRSARYKPKKDAEHKMMRALKLLLPDLKDEKPKNKRKQNRTSDRDNDWTCMFSQISSMADINLKCIINTN